MLRNFCWLELRLDLLAPRACWFPMLLYRFEEVPAMGAPMCWWDFSSELCTPWGFLEFELFCPVLVPANPSLKRPPLYDFPICC